MQAKLFNAASLTLRYVIGHLSHTGGGERTLGSVPSYHVPSRKQVDDAEQTHGEPTKRKVVSVISSLHQELRLTCVVKIRTDPD